MDFNDLTNFVFDANYKQLELITLQKNHMETLKIVSTKGFSSKTVIDISGNNFSSIEIQLENLQPHDNFTLNLSDNPLQCDMSLHQLFYDEEEIPQLNLDFETVKCAGPDRIKGEFLSKLSRKDLMCNSLNYFSNCLCFYTPNVKTLFVNCTQLGLNLTPDFSADYNLTMTTLAIDHVEFHFEINSLKSLPAFASNFTFNVTKVFAFNNSIAELKLISIAESTEVLDLRNNSLKFLAEEVMEKLKRIKNVSLGGNPWLCDCSTLDFFNAMKAQKNHINDFNDMYCDNLNRMFDDLESFEVCFNWPIVAGVSGGLGVVGVILALFYKYQKDIKIFLYAHDMCLWFVSEDELDEDKVYDAFVCFADPDQPIVEDIILGLEAEPESFQCLVGIRDWPPGHMFTQLVSCLVV